jgi:UDP-2-acetamido-3-amino-2,3-dideoxy-glucuronate N-acetyltransferase
MGKESNYIADTAKCPDDLKIGHFCVIGDEVEIGRGCVLGSHVTIHDGSRIGEGVRIDDGAVIGKQPMRAANSAVTKDEAMPPVVIGDGCIIGTHTVIYAGAKLSDRVLVADLATVRENVEIGEGTIIGRGAAVENLCVIGRFCKIETNVYLTAYSELGDRVFVAPCVATSNDNFVGRTKERFKHYKGVIIKTGGRVGVNATILPGKVVGEDALVAAGALLTNDAPAGKISVGAPARPIKPVPEEQLLKNQ